MSNAFDIENDAAEIATESHDPLAEENASLAVLVDVLRSSCEERKCIAEQAIAMGERLKAENARLQEAVACAKSTMDGLADEAVRVLALVNATRRLVAALPRCSYCAKPAMHYTNPRYFTRYCDGCVPLGEVTTEKFTPALRDTVAALAALDKETSR